jgi:hypothetical protein
MRIGTSIGLLALGLILALAVRVDIGGIDLELVGWILAVVGAIGLIARPARSCAGRPSTRRRAPTRRTPATRPG